MKKTPEEVEKEIQKILKDNNYGMEVLYKIKVRRLEAKDKK